VNRKGFGAGRNFSPLPLLPFENKESKVLVINTGGNLFMVHSDKGYVAARGLAECLKKNVTLHDAEYAT